MAKKIDREYEEKSISMAMSDEDRRVADQIVNSVWNNEKLSRSQIKYIGIKLYNMM